MSYDFPDDHVPPPKPPFTVRGWVSERYWRFVLWCTLDSGVAVLERWGDRRLHKTDEA